MNQNELQALWKHVLGKTQESLNKEACKKWLKPCQPLAVDDESFTLGTPSEFYKDWIRRYLPLLEAAVYDVLGKTLEVKLDILPDSPAEKSTGPVQDSLITPETPPISSPPPTAAKAPEQISPGDASTLNPRYTFENFVPGDSNAMAHAASLAVAESPGIRYNPLFMVGDVGLGKTHLMQAIGNRIIATYPEKRVLYVSSEDFTNQVILAIKNGATENFRLKYRTIDVLLIDDIQFLAGKESTQNEFFHTFNTLYNAQKQIIISSDRPPKDLGELEDRLISRFTAGLPVDIQAPDLETRIAILKKKAQLDRLNVPGDVMAYIAGRIDSNIRELEGALTRVVAFSSLTRRTITTELATEALKNIFTSRKNQEITVDLIKEVVAGYFKISVEDLSAKKRTRQIAFPRQIAMYLCRDIMDESLPQIGLAFGGRDHSTVIHACEKISRDQEDDRKLAGIIKELKERIEG